MVSILSQKFATTFSTKRQGKHSSKGFALIRDVSLRACGRVFGSKLGVGRLTNKYLIAGAFALSCLKLKQL